MDNNANVARDLTFGERAVGISFNPSKNENVESLKRLHAAAIDKINDLREQSTDNEEKAMYTLAIRDLQRAQMWAVKAATWNL